MSSLRVVHYLNQFFGGVGGEKAANIALEVRDGAVGPGRLLQEILADQGAVVSTIICGDNYFSEQRDAALASLGQALHAAKPDVVVAGPAFDAGRYGIACAEVCKASQEMGVPAITAMHPENPGILTHGREIIAVPTGDSPAEMRKVLQAVARLAVELRQGQELGTAAAEGYLPRGRAELLALPEFDSKTRHGLQHLSHFRRTVARRDSDDLPAVGKDAWIFRVHGGNGRDAHLLRCLAYLR